MALWSSWSLLIATGLSRMMRAGLAFRAPYHLHVIQIWEGLVARRVIGGNNGHKGRDFRHAAYKLLAA